ncbi:MAG TPA: PIN domain-containing protein [Pseudonocardiaceae bacterium]|jgi:predicted nucleic acid-binding protein|nr:PIN domain-containing protein [Pseudonocardiaceae bacterium]
MALLIWPVVYDAGALLAAERDDDRMREVHRMCLSRGLEPIVPAPVVTQAWRDGAKQARVARLLRGCRIAPTNEPIAKRAGVLLGRSGLADAVDALVMATALEARASVVTSDPDDLAKLAAAGLPQPSPQLIVI